MHNTKSAFVIMPFSTTTVVSPSGTISQTTETEWSETYKFVFKPALEDCGYSCERARPTTGSLIGSIIDKLRHAKVVLADLTDSNPNVFYELAVRHALRKGTIVVAQGTHNIPSDLKGYWFLTYGKSLAEVALFRTNIRKLIADIEEHPEKSGNPVADYLEQENLAISSYAQRENIKKLGALYTELTGNDFVLKGITSKSYREKFLSVDCMKLLYQTMYVDVGPDLLKLTYELHRKLNAIEAGASSRSLLVSALADNSRLMNEVLKLKERLVQGEFNEPSVITTMKWEPPTSLDVYTDAPKRVRILKSSYSQKAQCRDAGAAPELFSRSNKSDVDSLQMKRGAVLVWTCGRAHDLEPLEASALNIRGRKRDIAYPPNQKQSRKQPCPCGSGKMLKNCCGN